MRLARWMSRIAKTLIVVSIVIGVALWWRLNSSLAPLEGELILQGLRSDVLVERDVQGVPTITANDRFDAAFALGVLHAQERFFQIDLLRRNSAGELSELVGAAALSHDKQVRIHQFRKRADNALAALSKNDKELLQFYTDGVNAGLNGLNSRPFEYDFLRTNPLPWAVSDSFLVAYSMYLDLQPEWDEFGRSLAVMRDVLPPDWYQFLTPEGGVWDSPIHGDPISQQLQFPERPLAEFADSKASDETAWTYSDSTQVGSNNWSVAGSLTNYDAGIVANDMHLGLNVPNIWYRASWFVGPDKRRITGATLPGTPMLVVGSNEQVAWGFTNTYGDYHDSIVLKTNADETEYLTVDGWQAFKIEKEIVEVKSAEPVEVAIKLTRWGPVIGQDHNNNLLALHWVAHDVEGVNLNPLKLENANSVADALEVAATAGIPGQNLNVVDRQGNQAWTIMGRLPRRIGFDESGVSASQPSDWSTGELGWEGYLAPQEYPRVVNPSNGRLWTANARVVSGEMLNQVGSSGYALGARQQQIKKNLFTHNTFNEQQLFAIALDDRALFLQRWQQLLLEQLSADVIGDNPNLAALRRYVSEWEGRASKSSVGYRIVRAFRQQVIDQTAGEIYRYVQNELEKKENVTDKKDKDIPTRVFWPGRISNLAEYPVWALVNEQPEQHVPAGFSDWPSFLVAMAKDVVVDLSKDGASLGQQTWGKANSLAIKHPLSSAVPFLSPWLDMPAEPMDGDTFMPRVQRPNFGPSQRMVVAPGREEAGIFHMPAGQSAHPLSPFHSEGHRDWVEGNPSPFLPGETQWRMVLKPL